MTGSSEAAGDAGGETELVSRQKGEALAKAWKQEPRALRISDTLLSSQAIIKVVEATGLIAPFFTGGGRQARLKKAAYEGRIGTRAYIFNELNSPQRCFDSEVDKFLLVPRNSIVFVECDLDFRLPDFIALRFNLQIQHVHRGLLLGTGPLVDPGYWGKLCIPLHNLTDEDYAIPKDKGLIWIEFTKTTLNSADVDAERAPLGREFWDIEAFLNKASQQYYGHKVPIRSSLPTMFEAANKKVEESAKAAEDTAKSAADLRSLNTIALVAAAFTLVTIIVGSTAFLFNLSNRNEDIAVKLRSDTETTQHAIEEHVTDVDRFATQPAEARAALPGLRRQLADQRRQIDDLKQQIVRLDARLDQMKRDQIVSEGGHLP